MPSNTLASMSEEGYSGTQSQYHENLLRDSSHCFREVAAEYPDIPAEERIIDATCMEMVRRPQIFDVIVTTNLFGDILSDLAAGLVGGLGVLRAQTTEITRVF